MPSWDFLHNLPYVCNSTDLLIFRKQKVAWEEIIPDFAVRSLLVSSHSVLEFFQSVGQITSEPPLPTLFSNGLAFSACGAYNLLTNFGVFRLLILPSSPSHQDVVTIGQFFSSNVVHSGFDVANCTNINQAASAVYYPNLFHKLFRSDQPLGLICGQASMTLCALYHTLGYPARQAHFEGPNGGHFSTEVFDGNRWVLVDADFDCVVKDETGQLVDAEHVARCLLLNDAERLQVVSLSRKRWPVVSRAFLWGFYGGCTWRREDQCGDDSPCCSDTFLSQLKGMVVRRRDCSFRDGILTMSWSKLAPSAADEPNTTVPIGEQIERKRERIANTNRELLGHYDAAIAKLDIARNQELIYRYGASVGFDGPLKSLDCAYWLGQKLQIAAELGLHRSRPLRILDIGTGGGHFPLICMVLGHEVIGLDIDIPIYQDICAMFDIRRVPHRIARGRSLPDLGGPFDLITGFASQFDYVGGNEFWSRQDWRDFMDDVVLNYMCVPGRVYFSLNMLFDQASGEWRFKDYVGDVFREYGGRAEPGRSIVDLEVTDAVIDRIRLRK